MKTLLFYCQPIPDIGHLMLNMAIAHELTKDFKVYFVNGGGITQDFSISEHIEIINLPAVITEISFSDLKTPKVGAAMDIALLKRRRDLILELCDRIRPDAVMTELFPFGYHRFSIELIPLLQRAKDYGAKTICSLRDMIVAQPNQTDYESKVCQLINCYFDQLLIHSDPSFIALDRSFSRVHELICRIHYTGYVISDVNREFTPKTDTDPPMILVSIGSGNYGHEFLNCIAKASQYLENKIPHQIQLVTGPFAPAEVYKNLQAVAASCSNLTVQRYIPDLLSYMSKADLFIGMAGYNTMLDILQTGVPAIQLPCMENNGLEQQFRSNRLKAFGLLKVIQQAHFKPILLSFEILESLSRQVRPVYFCLRGAQITAARRQK